MKTKLASLLIASALPGCALDTPPLVPKTAATPTLATKASSLQSEERGYNSAMVGENSYEIKYSGPWTGSRDALEGGLLYHAAFTARQHGSAWFRFLHMPGEGGPVSHPSRPSAKFGAAYGHWQPHWSYLTGDGWQPWHPEWGDRFWAERPASSNVKQVEVHAMVELRPGIVARSEQTDFEVSAVLRDLRSFKSSKGR